MSRASGLVSMTLRSVGPCRSDPRDAREVRLGHGARRALAGRHRRRELADRELLELERFRRCSGLQSALWRGCRSRLCHGSGLRRCFRLERRPAGSGAGGQRRAGQRTGAQKPAPVDGAWVIHGYGTVMLRGT